ncbi:putative membrane protein [Sphingopyxis fribergensis]|uniref:Putative membrane protein n=1 Tax=Sphingopyxis fribergensis TaxID=1515612 RepID=A0A0A7PG23_9SPHN|nr:EamA family transporter [Sphingopyxis fribergensis]AJA08158.1 putative membrane protein [Sphingopyxis fribergensis]
MNPIWLPASLLGGLFQAWRTALQQRLRAELSISGAGLVRYLYGVPFAFVFAGIWLTVQREAIPVFGAGFAAFAFAGAITQMAGTILLIMAFGHRGFVVGTAFSKTEAVQAALVTALFLGERLPLLAWIGIVAGVAGVLMLALAGRGVSWREIWRALGQPAALCGLGAGSMFALAAIAVKLATAELDGVDLIGSALITLVVVMATQTALHLAWVSVRDRDTLRAVCRQWRTSSQVGLLSALGSACWYIGFAAAPAALVRIVGQVEVIFTIGFAHFYLREPVRWHEIVGLLLVVGGVMMALLATF